MARTKMIRTSTWIDAACSVSAVEVLADVAIERVEVLQREQALDDDTCERAHEQPLVLAGSREQVRDEDIEDREVQQWAHLPDRDRGVMAGAAQPVDQPEEHESRERHHRLPHHAPVQPPRGITRACARSTTAR